ncbi:MAG: DUF177 domain-containing protein [Chloroflexi bacterium]|nr:DUF177 domain-containing protein [Chloroflexota bacterium]
MQFSVVQQLKGPIGSVRRYTLDDTVEACQGEGAQQVAGQVVFLRTDRGILVTGHLETAIEATCSRCLASYRQAAAFDLEEEFFPTVDVTTGVRLPSPPEEGAFTIDAHHILDLREAVRQYTLLNLPMKPLCKPDCRGLCAQCGATLNEGPCGCIEARDPRWGPLGKLLAHSRSQN